MLAEGVCWSSLQACHTFPCYVYVKEIILNAAIGKFFFNNSAKSDLTGNTSKNIPKYSKCSALREDLLVLAYLLSSSVCSSALRCLHVAHLVNETGDSLHHNLIISFAESWREADASKNKFSIPKRCLEPRVNSLLKDQIFHL